MKIKDRAYAYSLQMIGFLDALPKDPSTSIISRQLLRSATSVKSANESLYWLGLLRDAKRITGAELHRLFQETQEIANILGSSMLTLKGRR